MSAFSTVLKKELVEAYRSKKLLILLIVFTFVSVSSPILAKLIPSLIKTIPNTGITINLPAATWKDSIDQFIKNLAQFDFIVIIFMFAGIIAEEKNKKTLELVLTKPIPRTSFVLAKFFSSTLCVQFVFAVSAVVFYFYTLSLLGPFSIINFIWLCLFVLIFLTLTLSVTIFFSVLTNNQVAAAGISFLASILFTTIINYIKVLADYSPSYIISNYKTLMENGNISNFLPPAIASLCLILILVIASISLFKNQEIER
jgi:ABC-2 type transport system permease protein